MIKLQGQDKLLARLAKARHPNAVVRLATREGAKIVMAEVKQSLPQRTGTTARNVKVRSAGKVPGAKVIVGLPGTETYKGWFLEYGTGPRYTKHGAFRGQVRGGHYVEKAVDKTGQQTMSKVQEIIGAKIWQ
jgi:HK97 gp10 family phage protein